MRGRSVTEFFRVILQMTNTSMGTPEHITDISATSEFRGNLELVHEKKKKWL